MAQLQFQFSRQQQTVTTHTQLGRGIVDHVKPAVTGTFKRARVDEGRPAAEMGSGLPAELDGAFQQQWASAGNEQDLQV